MIIPKGSAEREQLYDEVIKQCEKSQPDRSAAYEKYRSYYLFGSDNEDDEVPFNKVYPHLDTLTSFLFAAETTKFGVIPDVSEPEIEDFRSGTFAEAINERWHESNTDSVVAGCVLWALVYNTMIAKVVPVVNRETKDLQINPFAVHPATFGVYREDVNTLDRQQALVQTYYTTEDEFSKRLNGHPNKQEILNMLTPVTQEEERGNKFTRVIMGTWQPIGQTPAASGAMSMNMSGDLGYRPEELDKLRVLKELWIWDDELNDYRVVTRPKDGGMSIFDTPNPLLNGEHPFIKFTPRPLPFYVWGESEVKGLSGLQKWRNEYIIWMRDILDKQLNPPVTLTGFGAIEEDAYAKFISGSYLTDMAGGGMPGAQANMMRPPMPQDIYRMIGEIDNSFNEYSGLPNTVQGKGEIGVRSGKQADSLARLGSARIKKRALVIEDALEKMAYIYARVMQKYDDTFYKDTQKQDFVLAQFTNKYKVKVDGHSNSPVFIEDKRDLAFALLKDGLITKERAIDMIDPPNKEMMTRELSKIEQGAAASQKSQEDAELKKVALQHAPQNFIEKLLAKFFGQ